LVVGTHAQCSAQAANSLAPAWLVASADSHHEAVSGTVRAERLFRVSSHESHASQEFTFPMGNRVLCTGRVLTQCAKH